MLHETQNVDRVSNLSREEFLQKYGICGKPVIFLDLMDNWKAKTCWTPEFFKSKYGATHVTVRKTKTPDDERTMRLGEYIDYMESTKEENPYYLKYWGFSDDCPELLEDYNIPEYFNSWHQQLPDEIRPRWSWIYIGSTNTGSGMHIDPAMSSAWNAVISGRKRWVFYPPEDEPYLYDGKVDAFNPDLKKYPLFAEARSLTCIQNSGEIIFTPGGWWHQVVNEENCIAITGNFVNETNYKMVKNYLEVSEVPKLNQLKQAVKQYIPQFYSNSQ
ncbi:cupin-like domain-containing protein [uncultured Nostoc sp.]|uniref:cupin-like domain-containing protein n=1 Tax=uncultured Nostoc sp. TaxID=340711 RepID=UPI0035C99756